MKIYTRTGDSGLTGLFGGGRIAKDAPAVEAYGSVDELNAGLGVARATLGPGRLDALLAEIQTDLFTLGAELGCAPGQHDKLRLALVSAEDTARLERHIDEAEANLAPLRTFILPGGTPGAATLHLARTLCRRAERRVLAARHEGSVRDEVVHYLNRLSDLLFVLARRANAEAGVEDVPWQPKAEARG
ncbi:MAG TPA: cob(I)yrinic acid a,c-diamide adenosyltransferase [Polyangiaceae bacterium]|nr:cob(I)yrinic acid a,c-diamide adenosyltransferase [Polyangiaceae bacterium]